MPQLAPTESHVADWRFWVLCVLLSTVVLMTYWPAISAQALLFDDNQYLTDNPVVQNPSWSTVGRFFGEVLEPSTVRGYYQPLAMISIMLDVALGGTTDDLTVFHFTSIAIHLANTVLIAVFVLLCFGNRSIAVLAALIFGVHPVTVESIPWVAERKTILAAMFVFASLVTYVCYAQRRSRLCYVGSVLLFLLALFSKPTSVPLPALLLALDVWPLRRLSKQCLLEKTPYFVLAAVFAIIAVVSQARTAAVSVPGEYPWWHAPLLVCHNISFYIGRFVWPIDLSPHYPFPEPFGVGTPSVMLGIIVTVLLAAMLYWSWHRTRMVAGGILFYLVALAPAVGVIRFHPVIAADRHMYLPMIGFILLIAGIAKQMLARGQRVALWAALVGLSCIEIGVTRDYLSHWRDTESIYRRMLSYAPNVGELHNHMAKALQGSGRPAQASKHLRQAIAVGTSQDRLVAHNNLGYISLARNDIEGAKAQFMKALALEPEYAQAHHNLANVYVLQGGVQEAASHYERAIALQPHLLDAYLSLADVYRQQGQYDQALSTYDRALAAVPQSIDIQRRRASCLCESGDVGQGLEQLQDLAKRAPRNSQVQYDLGLTYLNLGQWESAKKHLQVVIDAAPQHAAAHNLMAVAFMTTGDLADAEAFARRALQINREFPQAHNNLGIILARQNQPQLAISHFRKAVQLDPRYVEAQQNLELTERQTQQVPASFAPTNP